MTTTRTSAILSTLDTAVSTVAKELSLPAAAALVAYTGDEIIQKSRAYPGSDAKDLAKDGPALISSRLNAAVLGVTFGGLLYTLLRKGTSLNWKQAAGVGCVTLTGMAGAVVAIMNYGREQNEFTSGVYAATGGSTLFKAATALTAHYAAKNMAEERVASGVLIV